MSFKEYLGEQGALLPRIATGFGAGIGRRGSLCGAFTGSMMVLGMMFGRTEAADKVRKERNLALGYRFWDRFEKENGSCTCYNLIQCHLDNAEERKRWLDSGGLETCRTVVGKTARLLHEFIEEEKRNEMA